MKIGTLAIATFAIGALTGSAFAAPLNLVLQPAPDIASGFVSVSYNATTHAFSATGTALSIELNGTGGPDANITNGRFSITGSISSAGVLSAATLSITGTIPSLGATSPLITANLTNFGFRTSPVTQIFEFTGPTTGGFYAGTYGSTVGVILDLAGGFAGNFTSNFSNSGFGVADTGRPTPTPGAMALLGLGGLVAARRRR